MVRDVQILLAEFLEKCDVKSKEQKCWVGKRVAEGLELTLLCAWQRLRCYMQHCGSSGSWYCQFKN